MTLPQKNGHRIKTPSSKLTILVSTYWKKNFIRNNAHSFFNLSLVFLILLIKSVASFWATLYGMSENPTPLLLPACIFMNSGSTVVQICAMVSITLIFLHRLLCCSDHGIVFHNTQRYRWISSLKCFHTHTQQPPELSDHTCVQMSYKGGRVSFSGPWTTCTCTCTYTGWPRNNGTVDTVRTLL